ncbi:MAG: glycosyltransferase [Phycisphaeraceae bacterium]|nr:glycosyltransferase [Phycisphaeraceae bacterium]
MRAVIVVDRWMAGRETGMLSRLEIGLADEGYRVVRAMPVAALGGEQGGVYSTVAGYVDTGLGFTLPRRVGVLVETLDALATKQGDKGGVSVVHGFGARAWPVAVELARQTGAALVLEIDRTALIADAGRLADVAAAKEAEAGPTPYFLCAAEPLRAMLSARVSGARSSLARWGVYVPPARRARAEVRAVAMFVERGDSRGAAAALEALARVAADEPTLMIFAHIQDDRNAPYWKVARRLNLLDRLSLSPDMESRREPALQMDAMLLPDASGTAHSIALDAMAAGMAVLAAPDERVEYLRGGQTARIVLRADARDWEDAVRDSVLDAPRWGVLGATAREYVRAAHPVAGHIHSVLAAYSEAVRLHAEDADLRAKRPASATLR